MNFKWATFNGHRKFPIKKESFYYNCDVSQNDMYLFHALIKLFYIYISHRMTVRAVNKLLQSVKYSWTPISFARSVPSHEINLSAGFLKRYDYFHISLVFKLFAFMLMEIYVEVIVAWLMKIWGILMCSFYIQLVNN